jgi:23S rRNA (cytosine1962-C5)-methyltransferase
MSAQTSIKIFTPKFWNAYELIDSGGGEKMERFGSLTTIRPEPQALWDKVLTEKEWNTIADVRFLQKGSHSGEWINLNKQSNKWQMGYESPQMKLKFNLSLTSFKHVGVFPEQATNWEFIYERIKSLKTTEVPRVLNLFAYTGGASLAAKAAGADITHVDSVKQVISWSRENMESSNLKDIRWVVEDAFKFVKREAKRGKTYHGIMLDPPAYGIGANGERWKLEDHINDMLKEIKSILADEYFVVLNMYSLGMSPLITQNLTNSVFGNCKMQEHGEIYLQSKTEQKLPLGIVSRISNY